MNAIFASEIVTPESYCQMTVWVGRHNYPLDILGHCSDAKIAQHVSTVIPTRRVIPTSAALSCVPFLCHPLCAECLNISKVFADGHTASNAPDLF